MSEVCVIIHNMIIYMNGDSTFEADIVEIYNLEILAELTGKLMYLAYRREKLGMVVRVKQIQGTCLITLGFRNLFQLHLPPVTPVLNSAYQQHPPVTQHIHHLRDHSCTQRGTVAV